MLDAPSSSISISMTPKHPYRGKRSKILDVPSSGVIISIASTCPYRGKRLVFLPLHLVAGSLDTTSVVSWAPSARFSERKVTGPMRGAVGGT
ncbi:unnamed protein product [Musa hybrid cultivar]